MIGPKFIRAEFFSAYGSGLFSLAYRLWPKGLGPGSGQLGGLARATRLSLSRWLVFVVFWFLARKEEPTALGEAQRAAN